MFCQGVRNRIAPDPIHSAGLLTVSLIVYRLMITKTGSILTYVPGSSSIPGTAQAGRFVNIPSSPAVRHRVTIYGLVTAKGSLPFNPLIPSTSRYRWSSSIFSLADFSKIFCFPNEIFTILISVGVMRISYPVLFIRGG